MKAVLVSWAFPPSRFPRSVQVGRLTGHLSRLEPEVICSDEGQQDPSVDSVLGGRAVPVQRIPSPRWARPLRRPGARLRLLSPDAEVFWARAATAAVRSRGLRDGDALVTFGNPMSDHLVGLRTPRPSGVPWVAHFSDPWTDNPYYEPTFGPVHRRTLGLERLVMETADRLVFTSDETRQLVMAKYPASWNERARVLGHAYDPELYPVAGPATGDGLVVRYLGSLYGPRTQRPLIEALAVLRASHPRTLEGVSIEIVGSDPGPVAGAALRAGLPPGLVTAQAAVPYDRSLELMRSADLLLVIDAPAERSVFLPSKLVEYFGAGRPVLAITPPGPAQRLVDESGGWSADPGAPEDVATALAAALDAVRAAPAAAGPAPGTERFTASRIAAAFEDIVLGATG